MGEDIHEGTGEVTPIGTGSNIIFLPVWVSHRGFIMLRSIFKELWQLWFHGAAANLSGVASDKLPLLSAISRKFVLDTGDVSGALVS